MNTKIPFQVIDWNLVSQKSHEGLQGKSFWQVFQLPELRIRIVEYSPGYIADHWCTKGHIVHCLHGSFISEMENGESFELTEGMTYIVSDEMSSHRSISKHGVQLLIIDGVFLK
jgi:hypothetical protein